jgi:hypothetical protein
LRAVLDHVAFASGRVDTQVVEVVPLVPQHLMTGRVVTPKTAVLTATSSTAPPPARPVPEHLACRTPANEEAPGRTCYRMPSVLSKLVHR